MNVKNTFYTHKQDFLVIVNHLILKRGMDNAFKVKLICFHAFINHIELPISLKSLSNEIFVYCKISCFFLVKIITFWD